MNRRQAIPIQQRYTHKQFLADYPTDDVCLEAIFRKRFHDGIAYCPECKADRKHYRVQGRQCYACPSCGSHLFPLAGTIFHKSTTPLCTWFYVIKLMTSTRVGISAKQIQREVGVTYKTAWRMMKQVRTLMGEEIKLSGPVEIDDAQFGGSDENKHRQLIRAGRKQTVLGIVERRGRVVARVVPDMHKDTVFPVIEGSLHPRSMIYTDSHATYEQLRWMGQSHKHSTVNHSEGYVNGYAHTNTIDGFWSLVKRGIRGVYYQVGRGYLQSYLNEFAFRYNRRHAMRPMFAMLLERTTTQVCPSAYQARLTAGR
jgi:transposase-like protein